MAYYDLREFMQACDKAGEMVTIDKEVDWNLEVGAVSRRICEIGAPMAHMTKVRGISNGASILGSPLSKGWNSDFSRVAIALEMDPNSSYQELMDQFMKRMAAPHNPSDAHPGPCHPPDAGEQRSVQGEHSARQRDQPFQPSRALPA